jgi:hypothetical protein
MAEGDVFKYGRTPWPVAFQALRGKKIWKATAFCSPKDREAVEATQVNKA